MPTHLQGASQDLRLTQFLFITMGPCRGYTEVSGTPLQVKTLKGFTRSHPLGRLLSKKREKKKHHQNKELVRMRRKLEPL